MKRISFYISYKILATQNACSVLYNSTEETSFIHFNMKAHNLIQTLKSQGENPLLRWLTQKLDHDQEIESTFEECKKNSPIPILKVTNAICKLLAILAIYTNWDKENSLNDRTYSPESNMDNIKLFTCKIRDITVTYPDKRKLRAEMTSLIENAVPIEEEALFEKFLKEARTEANKFESFTRAIEQALKTTTKTHQDDITKLESIPEELTQNIIQALKKVH